MAFNATRWKKMDEIPEYLSHVPPLSDQKLWSQMHDRFDEAYGLIRSLRLETYEENHPPMLTH